MLQLISFQEALSLADKNRHLLIGNGFSIDWKKDIFLYDELFNKADFTPLTVDANILFTALKTKNFELVINALRNASLLSKIYATTDTSLAKRFLDDADHLKEILAKTIARNHPDAPNEISAIEYQYCRKFLSNFHHMYDLNYDLLLYWVLMHKEGGEDIICDDGFRNSDDESADYVIWDNGNSRDQNIHYVHGALHLFDAGTELQKFTWIKTQIKLIDQIREALNRGLFPLVVTEGSSGEKLTRINHSGYLHRARRSFYAIGGSLFIHGHSLADYDDHILGMIPETKVNKLFISFTSDSESLDNTKKILKIQNWVEQRKEMLRTKKIDGKKTARQELEVHYYKADTAHVWR